MDVIICPVCNSEIGSIDALGYHLKNIHQLPLSLPFPEKLNCHQELCSSELGSFRSLRAHLQKFHLVTSHNVLEGNHSDEEGNVTNVEGDHPSFLSESDFGSDVVWQKFDESNEVNHNYSYHVSSEESSVSSEDDNENLPENHDPDPDDSDHSFHEATFNENDVNFRDYHFQAVDLIKELLCKNNATQSIITEVVKRSEVIVSAVCSYLKDVAVNFLETNNLMNVDGCHEFLGEFDNVQPFYKLRSWKGQKSALKRYYGFVEPQQMQLGTRIENRLEENGVYTQHQVRETFQYIPLLKTLEMVLKHQKVRQMIDTEATSPEGVISTFRDGSHFQQSEFFQRYPTALRLQLYHDDVEVANPLLSKKCIHKLSTFYVSIQNLPPEYQSSLHFVFPLIIVYEQDVRKYGFRRILQPFLDDLLQLESEEGVTFTFGGNDFTFHGTLAAVSADSQAAHEMFGLLACGARHFCRQCMISRQEHHAGVSIGQMRTPELHAYFLRRMREDPLFTPTNCGLRRECCLHVSAHFNFMLVHVFDIMHDFLEGICYLIVKLVLRHFILVRHYFTAIEFNTMLTSFVYGYAERRDKPTPNFTADKLRDAETSHDLDQSAAQMWVLTRVIPFLVQHKVPENDPYMEILLTLIRIMEIAFSPKVHVSHLPILRDLIDQLRRSHHRLFPNVLPINKMHHIEHLTENIPEVGSMRWYWCMNYERYHRTLKCRANVSCNFIDVPQTTAKRGQVFSCSVWSGDEPVALQKVSDLKGEIVDAVSLDSFPHLLQEMGIEERTGVFKASSVKLHGTEYRTGLFVVVDGGGFEGDQEPTFGLIKEVLYLNDNVLLYVHHWVNHGIDPELNAYGLEESHNVTSVINADNLPYSTAMSIWREVGTNLPYLSPRHVIF